MAAQLPDARKLEAEVAFTSETNEQSGKYPLSHLLRHKSLLKNKV